MTPEHFDKILERRLDRTRQVLASKGTEYASNSDRLHNFKAAARLLGSTPEAALLGFLTKHLVSVVDMVKALPDTVPAPGRVDEKIGDCINYLVLLEALWEERRVPVAEKKPPCNHKWMPAYDSKFELCTECLQERPRP